MNDIENILNQSAQGLISNEDAVAWFMDLNAQTKTDVLRKLQYFSLQAGANSEDAEQAILDSKLKSTFTPCVLLKTKEIREAVSKTVILPEAESDKSFKLLLALFSIADTRRRKTTCVNGCSHEWHKT